MEGVESKAESQGQDSQNMSQNVEGFQQYVKEILNLIDQDEILSEITPEIYDSKKSKLTKLVTELSRMYGALADQHVYSIKEVNTSKVKKPRVHDPDVLLKKISNLEKEELSLKKKIRDLRDENALLEAEKANVPDLKLMISESNRKNEVMRKALEGSRKQVLAAEEENLKLKVVQEDLSSKVFELIHGLRELDYIRQKIDLLEKQFDEEEARDPKLQEKVSLDLAEMENRDEQIKELRRQLRENWNTDIERLRTELMEKCDLTDDLNQKHDELKEK